MSLLQEGRGVGGGGGVMAETCFLEEIKNMYKYCYFVLWGYVWDQTEWLNCDVQYSVPVIALTALFSLKIPNARSGLQTSQH